MFHVILLILQPHQLIIYFFDAPIAFLLQLKYPRNELLRELQFQVIGD